MAVLPAGFGLPALPYLVALLAASVSVAVGFYRRRPPVASRHVVALVPWVICGSAAHVLYIRGWLPGLLRPLAGTPAVYVSLGAAAGAAWLTLDVTTVDTPRGRLVTGTAVATPAVVEVGLAGHRTGSLSPLWPAVALTVALATGAGVWLGIARFRPDTSAVTGRAGALVVFAHAIDGVSTAVGIDILGYGERTPLSALVLRAGQTLPTAEVIGVGWLFVVVKLTLGAVVVVLLTDLVRTDPRQGNLLLALVVAVGLGPGIHNLLLFTVP
jgi:uncharacterized membrane protein